MSKIVTSQQANRLVALGYNIVLHCSCHGYECIGCKSVNLSNAKKLSVSDALDWVREEKDIACSVHLMMKLADDSNKLIADNYSWEFWTKDDGINIDFVRYTHPIASSALLDAVLTYLEQKEKKV